MKPNLYLIFKHSRYLLGFSHRTRRRIHTGPPVLPCGLCIDREKPLANTAPPYNQHVVIGTGRDDWASRIEKEEGPNLAKGLKELLGLNGEFHHVRPRRLHRSLASAYIYADNADHVTKVSRIIVSSSPIHLFHQTSKQESMRNISPQHISSPASSTSRASRILKKVSAHLLENSFHEPATLSRPLLTHLRLFRPNHRLISHPNP